MAQLLTRPKIGAPRSIRKSALKGLRSWPVDGFEEFLIFYVVQVELLRIVRILHGKRDLGRIAFARRHI